VNLSLKILLNCLLPWPLLPTLTDENKAEAFGLKQLNHDCALDEQVADLKCVDG
jgi:hypothetical protein